MTVSCIDAFSFPLLLTVSLCVYTGQLETLRHLKKEVIEARKGMECGLSLSNYSDDFLPGDIIQMYAIITKPAVL